MSKHNAAVTAEDHTQGDSTAPVTLVEYGDYQCPSCGDVVPVIQRLQKHFGKRLRFVFRNFPLSMHAHARPAAVTAEFAAAHGKFWEMHDLLFEHQDALGTHHLRGYAGQLGLPLTELEHALKDGEYDARIQRDMDSGEASGLHATPTFYLNGVELEDAYTYEALVEAVDLAFALRE